MRLKLLLLIISVSTILACTTQDIEKTVYMTNIQIKPLNTNDIIYFQTENDNTSKKIFSKDYSFSLNEIPENITVLSENNIYISEYKNNIDLSEIRRKLSLKIPFNQYIKSIYINNIKLSDIYNEIYIYYNLDFPIYLEYSDNTYIKYDFNGSQDKIIVPEKKQILQNIQQNVIFTKNTTDYNLFRISNLMNDLDEDNLKELLNIVTTLEDNQISENNISWNFMIYNQKENFLKISDQ